MRAYQLPKGGAGIKSMVQVDRPDPAKPVHRQVLVRVRACSLNFRDLGIVRGSYRMPVRENIIPLSDGAGEVVEVGAASPRQGRRPGRRQLLSALDRRRAGGGRDGERAGRRRDGMLADYAVLAEDGVAKVPAQLTSRRPRPCPAPPSPPGTPWWRRPAHRRADRAGAGHRRRLDLRAAVREEPGRPGDRRLVVRREARAGARAIGAGRQ